MIASQTYQTSVSNPTPFMFSRVIKFFLCLSLALYFQTDTRLKLLLQPSNILMTVSSVEIYLLIGLSVCIDMRV